VFERRSPGNRLLCAFNLGLSERIWRPNAEREWQAIESVGGTKDWSFPPLSGLNRPMVALTGRSSALVWSGAAVLALYIPSQVNAGEHAADMQWRGQKVSVRIEPLRAGPAHGGVAPPKCGAPIDFEDIERAWPIACCESTATRTCGAQRHVRRFVCPALADTRLRPRITNRR